MSDNTDRGVHRLKHHENFYLRDGNVCFLVENTIFRLHKYFFERESDYFRRRFQASDEDDGSANKPYVIGESVKADEFAQFIWVWYNPKYTFSKQGKQQWLTILKLATMWQFHDVRHLAIHQLEKLKLEPVEKITEYKKYSVESDLLLSSYVTLCRSPKLPSPEEGNILTMETVLRLANAREQVVLRASELGCTTPSTAEAPDDLVQTVVAQSFGLNLPADSILSDSSTADDVVTVKAPEPNKRENPSGSQTQLPANGSTGRGKKKAGN